MAFGQPSIGGAANQTSTSTSKFDVPSPKQQPPRGSRQQNFGGPPPTPRNAKGQFIRRERPLLEQDDLSRPNYRNSVKKEGPALRRFAQPPSQQTENKFQGQKTRGQGVRKAFTVPPVSWNPAAGRTKRGPSPPLDSRAQAAFQLRLTELTTTSTSKRAQFDTKLHLGGEPSPCDPETLSDAQYTPVNQHEFHQDETALQKTGTFSLALGKVLGTVTEVDLGICDLDWLINWTRRFASEWNLKNSSKLLPDQIEQTIAEAHQLLISEDLLGRRVSEVFDDVAAWLGNRFSYYQVQDHTPDFEAASESRNTKFPTTSVWRMPAPTMPGAQLGQFLVLVNGYIQHKNEDGLSNCVRIEPPFQNEYATMISELHQLYPKGKESALEDECRRVLSAAREGVDGSGTWTPFILFMVQYLVYLRDYRDGTEYILETFDRLSLLQKRANSALNNTMGYLMLHIVVTSAKFVSYLAITLDKNPQLLRNRNKATSQDEGAQAESLAEGAVNNLRDAFNTCATDRLAHVDSNGRPDGRKRGIYLIANICLKILFQCRKTNNATTFFDSIDTHSPPLSAYPKSQRVTYLYYLGRFHFQHSHFYRAYLALQQAHNESPTDQRCISQRRQILIYLMASSIICGRLPTNTLFEHLPEAQGMYEHFNPLLSAIRSGNLAAFRQAMDYNSPHAAFFLKNRIFLQLRNRCEVLVWRSLVRRTWILTGTRYNPAAGSSAPLVDGTNLLNAFYALEKQVQKPEEMAYRSSDFDGAEIEEDGEALLPTTTSVRSILSSLIEQGLIRGFIHTKSGKFVITGVKQHHGSELAAGFPSPWKVIEGKADKDVPGWKRDGSAHGGGGGKVIHLTGARPVGA